MPGQLMQIKAWLVDSEPEVWRRVLVDPRLTLEQLHEVLQHAFGWENAHLHQFHEQDGTRYAVPSPMDDDCGPPAVNERKTLLADVFTRVKKRIAYEYDFGDSWMHAVELEKFIDVEPAAPDPQKPSKGKKPVLPGAATCIDGKRSGPPEDCGGLYGFQHILELKVKPPHPTSKKDEYDREILEWAGAWDPEHFDLGAVNKELRRIKVKAANAR